MNLNNTDTPVSVSKKSIKEKLWFLWLIAFILMAATLYYQRTTGPTNEKRITVNFGDNEYKFKFLRSWGGEKDCPIILEVPDTSVKAALYFKRYKVVEDYKEVIFERNNSTLTAFLPHQPPAGKLEYFIVFKDSAGNKKPVSGDDTVIIRFKGDVPLAILLLHIFFMFFGMWLSNITGLLALFKNKLFVKYAVFTAIFLFIGGFIFGPIVQKYAFDVYWSGFPFDTDLTDNKHLISFGVWAIAILFSLKNPKYYLGIIAAIILIITFAIPHSAMGSEYDYNKGKMGTSKEFKL